MNGAGGERSEAEGVSVAMSPEATSRAVVGTLARGKVLRTDCTDEVGASTISVVIVGGRAGGNEAWSAEEADGADGGGAKQADGGPCRGGDSGMDSTGWRSVEACDGRIPH